MQLHDIPSSVFRPRPPPLWYVTNGDITVGPVVTPVLMRGVEYGRVPDYCHVRTPVGNWRKLDAVREIAALNGKVTGRSEAELPGAPLFGAAFAEAGAVRVFGDTHRRLARIRDEDELCYEITRLAHGITGAESAMFHYRARATHSLTTRCVFGPMSHEQLGEALPERDFVLQSARLGRPVIGPPYGPVEDALCIRFATSRGGVGAAAMIPIFVGGALTAMLELSRPGHAFRRSDLQRAERVAQQALLARRN